MTGQTDQSEGVRTRVPARVRTIFRRLSTNLRLASMANRELKLEVANLRSQLDERHIAMRVRQLEEALKDINALDPDVPDALAADALRGIVTQMGEIARDALKGKP